MVDNYITHIFKKISDYNPWSVSKAFKIVDFKHRMDVSVFEASNRSYTYMYCTLELKVRKYISIIMVHGKP